MSFVFYCANTSEKIRVFGCQDSFLSHPPTLSFLFFIFLVQFLPPTAFFSASIPPSTCQSGFYFLYFIEYHPNRFSHFNAGFLPYKTSFQLFPSHPAPPISFLLLSTPHRHPNQHCNVLYLSFLFFSRSAGIKVLMKKIWEAFSYLMYVSDSCLFSLLLLFPLSSRHPTTLLQITGLTWVPLPNATPRWPCEHQPRISLRKGLWIAVRHLLP